MGSAGNVGIDVAAKVVAFVINVVPKASLVEKTTADIIAHFVATTRYRYIMLLLDSIA